MTIKTAEYEVDKKTPPAGEQPVAASVVDTSAMVDIDVDTLPIATAVVYGTENDIENGNNDNENKTVISTTFTEATAAETTATTTANDVNNYNSEQQAQIRKNTKNCGRIVLVVGGLGVLAAIIIFSSLSRRNQQRYESNNYSNSTSNGGYNSNTHHNGGGYWFGKSTSSAGSYLGGGGKGGGGSCFPAGELVELLIQTDDGEHTKPQLALVPIEQIRPGDITVGGGKVTAIMKLLYVPESIQDSGETQGETLYRYNDSVCVTGSHTVPLESDSERLVFQAVEDSPLAALDHGNICGPQSPNLGNSNDHTPFYLYNLVTEKHQIRVSGTVLADWEEVDVPTDMTFEHAILHTLNHGDTASVPSFASREDATHLLTAAQNRNLEDAAAVIVGEGGFGPLTLVDTAGERGPIPIQDLAPGDALAEGGGEVLAVVQLLVPDRDCDTHTLQYYDDQIILSPWTIVLDPTDGAWRHVRDSPRSRPIRQAQDDVQEEQDASSIVDVPPATGKYTARDDTCILYQLITSTHQIPIAGTIFADYEVFDYL